MRAFFAAAVLIAATPAHAASDSVALALDEVHTLTFKTPVATVYVGNPAIADINMIDARHAFVLGKSFGTTNIIALDNMGRTVSNTYVSVSGSNGGTVTLMKGATQTTLSCTGQTCEAAPRPGDEHFNDVMGDVTKHQDLGVSSK